MTVRCLAVLLVMSLAHQASAQTSVMVYQFDSPGEGFNDPTPAEPVGGNEGTTLGEQRLIAFQYAADIWAAMLTSEEEVAIFANFDPLACEKDRGTLGQASPAEMAGNFPGALLPNRLYSSAQANANAGFDLDNNQPEIWAQFNSDIDKSSCLEKQGWYYGIDGEAGEDIDLVLVVLHEFGHGLGMTDYVNHETGSLPPQGYPTRYMDFVYDVDQGLYWSEMTSSQRRASVTNVERVAWDGEFVNREAEKLMLNGVPRFTADPPVSGLSDVLSDGFGPRPTAMPIVGPVQVAQPESACSAIAPMEGAIALIRRGGGCTSSDKAKNAETAGAVAALFVDDQDARPAYHPRAFGKDGEVGIPILGMALEDGDRLESAATSGTVMGTVRLDLSARSGMTPEGQLLLYASNPISPGSSIAHWDVSALPSLLMEPRATPNLPHTVDVTLAAFRDMGWPIASFCGNGELDGDEECDDGGANLDDRADACRLDCRFARCGDGFIDTGETCDDGNVAPGDGCDAACIVEPAPPPPPPPPPMAGMGPAAGMGAAGGTGAGMGPVAGVGAAGADMEPLDDKKKSEDDQGGCGCSTPGGRPASPALWGAVLLAYGLVVGRSVRRSRRATSAA